MSPWIAFVLGTMLGGSFAAAAMACLQAGKMSEYELELAELQKNTT